MYVCCVCMCVCETLIAFEPLDRPKRDVGGVRSGGGGGELEPIQ